MADQISCRSYVGSVYHMWSLAVCHSFSEKQLAINVNEKAFASSHKSCFSCFSSLFLRSGWTVTSLLDFVQNIISSCKGKKKSHPNGLSSEGKMLRQHWISRRLNIRTPYQLSYKYWCTTCREILCMYCIAHHSTILWYIGLVFLENKKQIGKKKTARHCYINKLKAICKKWGTLDEKLYMYDLRTFAPKIFPCTDFF